MPHFPKQRCLNFDQPIHDGASMKELEDVLGHLTEDEEESSISSASFSVLPSSPPLSLSSSSSFSHLISGTLEKEDGPATGMVVPSQHPPKSPQRAFTSISYSKLVEEPSDEEMEESSSSSESSADGESVNDKLIGEKITDLMHALVLKYQLKEPITKVEMLEIVTSEYQDLLPLIFAKAASCLEMFCGIDVKETDAVSHTYVLVNSLGLTYEEELSDEHSMPTNGFLIIILGVILIEGNKASLEDIWGFLEMIGVYEGEKHFIYGEPKKLMKDLVQKNYLECHPNPSSDPPCYEFLWGPRAKAETTKMKVLQFVAKIKGTDPSFFRDSYKEALREEAERVQAAVGPSK
ncbi:PREDICTED: melanoma-associated antigen 10-like [Chinchilla lanigera]|uniref:melanoma-associated antigen 10-like n=1 Tax=Chinchilla lanigera TaxID=34839 RepID=UPI00038F0C8A|nr:PREDICTED: melanoma-associated antigen 10-like [Chinchilla lanigera]XP_013359908.1 PREDICTED: melanoma-associated antigen 10-like [Chinchilla lanigera]